MGLERTTGEELDGRDFNYRWAGGREGITFQFDEQELRESLNVEFKQTLIGSDFLETVVAFSNGNGGTIFLGVDDKAEITGFADKDKDRIMNLIASNVEPTVQPNIRIFKFSDSRVITLVEIPEGKNKPYSHRELGVYVRKGATDRHATRIDLDQIYSKR
jgi:ATP-dependent DNA helicase RecG